MRVFKTSIASALGAALVTAQIGVSPAAPLPMNVAAMKSAVADTPTQVFWRRGWGWGWGFGAAAITGAIIGGAIASAPYAYYGAPYAYGYSYPYDGYYYPPAAYYPPHYGYGYGYGYGYPHAYYARPYGGYQYYGWQHPYY